MTGLPAAAYSRRCFQLEVLRRRCSLSSSNEGAKGSWSWRGLPSPPAAGSVRCFFIRDCIRTSRAKPIPSLAVVPRTRTPAVSASKVRSQCRFCTPALEVYGPSGPPGPPSPVRRRGPPLANTHSEGIKKMLWTICIILLVLWALGMATSYTAGGLLHLLLLIALVVMIFRLIQGRRVV
jgi:hypothetical protein